MLKILKWYAWENPNFIWKNMGFGSLYTQEWDLGEQFNVNVI